MESRSTLRPLLLEINMKASITFCTTSVLEWLSRTWDEDTYYHTPIGLTRVPVQRIADSCPLFPDKGIPKTVGDMRFPAGGHHVDGGRHLWLRSSGSVGVILADRLTLELDGPRHSVRELVPSFDAYELASWTVSDSQRPDLAPWLTTHDEGWLAGLIDAIQSGDDDAIADYDVPSLLTNHGPSTASVTDMYDYVRASAGR